MLQVNKYIMAYLTTHMTMITDVCHLGSEIVHLQTYYPAVTVLGIPVSSGIISKPGISKLFSKIL